MANSYDDPVALDLRIIELERERDAARAECAALRAALDELCTLMKATLSLQPKELMPRISAALAAARDAAPPSRDG